MDVEWSDDDLFIQDNNSFAAAIPKPKSAIKLSATSSTISSSLTKKPEKWLTSSFGSFGHGSDGHGSEKRTTVTKSQVSHRSKPETSQREEITLKRLSHIEPCAAQGLYQSKDVLLVDRYAPMHKNELIVHPKKVAEVENWLTSYFQSSQNKTPYLLLTGPGGCGKTVTVRVLCRHLSCELHEWHNPDNKQLVGIKDGLEQHKDWDHTRFESRYQDSQATLFRDYLVRCNKYNPLQIFQQSTSPRKLILIEEFPYAFFRDPSVFHTILRQLRRVSQCPLVFIASDCSRTSSVERLLFPKHIIDELLITHISFNAVAVTLMTKLLNRVSSTEAKPSGSLFVTPGPSVIEALAVSGAGDIRGTLNALQFAAFKGVSSTFTPTSNKPNKSGPVKRSHNGKGKGRLPKGATKCSLTPTDVGLTIGARDTSMFIFRALGKVLYCKRLDSSEADVSTPLLPHLSHQQRLPLAFSPEDVIDRAHISGVMFVSYLHQNYLPFYTNIYDIMRASDYISDSDYFLSHWQSKDALEESSVCVAVRGLLHANQTVSKTGSWKPLHLSQWFTTHRKVLYNCESARTMFRDQITFIQEISKFPHATYNHQTTAPLGEKEVILEHGDTSSEPSELGAISSSQSNVCEQREDDDDDEIVIGEFDND